MSAVTPNLRHLRLFLFAVEEGTLRQAAEKANLSQPAVTQAIARLEQQFACELLERTNAGVNPTTSGQILHDRVARMFDYLADMVRICEGARRAGSSMPIDRLMSTSQLRALVMIGTAKSFSAAARNMGVAQPSVHRVGREFEKLLGVRLFKKVSYGIELTTVGRNLAVQANLALREIDSAFQEITEANGVAASRVVVGSLPLARTHLLPEAITRLCNDMPGAFVKIVDGPYATLINLLKSGDLDVIIGALRGNELDEDLVEQTLFDDGLSVIGRAGHPLAGKANLEPEDLAAYPWIISPQGTPTRDHFDALMLQVKPRLGLVETSSLSVLRGVLLRSDRLTLLSRRQIFYEQELGLLVPLTEDLGFTQRTIGLTTRKNWKPTKLQAALIGHVTDVAGGRPDL